ncbi:MAG: hypothetical protein VX589_09680 [Myxococcota bacterium]|nr:hypothetical protein [Myxococcota bacterium]
MSPRLIVPSAHVNALGLVQSARTVGWSAPIVCLQSKPGQNTICGRFPEQCDTVYLPLRQPADLGPSLRARYPDDHMTVLMTDERYLGVLAGQTGFSTVRGAGAALDTVVRKDAFYAFVREHEFAATPRVCDSRSDPWSFFDGPFRTHVWRSWAGTTKLPRGRLVSDRADLESWRRDVLAAELAASDWGYVEHLGTKVIHNVSVCGWWDKDHDILTVTRRRAVANGIGWWVERIDDPAYLKGITRRILAALDYCGPFELEFMWDRRDDAFRVIELNPRFWMQHLLVNVACDHALTRLALGMPLSGQTLAHRPRHWLQPDVLATRPWSAISALPNAVLAYPPRHVVSAAVGRLKARVGAGRGAR